MYINDHNFLVPLFQEDCQLCLPGHFCDAVGLSEPTGKCWEGFFCLEGAERPDPFPQDSRGGPCPKGQPSKKCSNNTDCLGALFIWSMLSCLCLWYIQLVQKPVDLIALTLKSCRVDCETQTVPCELLVYNKPVFV